MPATQPTAYAKNTVSESVLVLSDGLFAVNVHSVEAAKVDISISTLLVPVSS